MYCSYNVKLFKNFVSMKTTIKPQLSDDWEMVPDTYRSKDGFKLYSKKLNQTVADIDLRRFLTFCKEQNLVIEGLKLKGEYIIGNDRSVYNLEMYSKWKEKYDKRTETIIDKKDLIPGRKYETPCGSQFTYLGKYNIIFLKQRQEEGKDLQVTKQSYKHLIYSQGVSVLNQKVLKEIGINDSINIEEKIDNYSDLLNICYLSKERLKDPVIYYEEVSSHNLKDRYLSNLLFDVDARIEGNRLESDELISSKLIKILNNYDFEVIEHGKFLKLYYVYSEILILDGKFKKLTVKRPMSYYNGQKKFKINNIYRVKCKEK